MPKIATDQLDTRYPSIADLRTRARRRIPHFVWEYLDSATGTEATQRRNRAALDQVLFLPSVLHGEVAADLNTKLMGRTHSLPFGIAPVGMSGLMWPDAERLLARAARDAGIPYGLSTVATRSPEELADDIGDGWFQLYPPRDEDIRRDMLTRAEKAGFHTLVLTVDVPVASRRERQLRGGLTNPPALTPRLVAQIARCPAWAYAMVAFSGGDMPRMATLDPYVSDAKTPQSSTAHVGYLLRTAPDWGYLSWLRDNWRGKLVVKGVMRAEDAHRLESEGVDAVWVSNHAGRQFDAAPAVIDALPAIRAATSLPVICDSGIESGLDILRAIALGADFVMFGRAFHYALGALGARGPGHLIGLLTRDLIANLGQLGVASPHALRGAAFRNGTLPQTMAIQTSA
ncbi:MAG: alpha-hydroxy-acid oxidizing protein [Roseivivax sp.]|nr:alpha-hydroxy-acid oxidizing protein [Roseivivax sp.]